MSFNCLILIACFHSLSVLLEYFVLHHTTEAFGTVKQNFFAAQNLKIALIPCKN